MATSKKGRPPSESPKDFMLRTRMDKETLEKLDYVAKELNATRSDVVRKGIDIQYDQIK